MYWHKLHIFTEVYSSGSWEASTSPRFMLFLPVRIVTRWLLGRLPWWMAISTGAKVYSPHKLHFDRGASVHLERDARVCYTQWWAWVSRVICYGVLILHPQRKRRRMTSLHSRSLPLPVKRNGVGRSIRKRRMFLWQSLRLLKKTLVGRVWVHWPRGWAGVVSACCWKAP